MGTRAGGCARAHTHAERWEEDTYSLFSHRTKASSYSLKPESNGHQLADLEYLRSSNHQQAATSKSWAPSHKRLLLG